MVRRFVSSGRGLGPVLVRFRLGRRQTVVQRRLPAVVVVRAGTAVAVGQQRVFAATGHLVLDEPAYVGQREYSLTLSAREQVHLIGAARALSWVRIRCEQKNKTKTVRQTYKYIFIGRHMSIIVRIVHFVMVVHIGFNDENQ